MNYTEPLIKKAKDEKCDICYQSITAKEADNQDFHYSRTKRKTDIYVHKKCWESLYGKS